MSRGRQRRSQHLRVCALNRASSRVEDVCCVGRRPGRDPGELAHAPFEMVALALPMERRRRHLGPEACHLPHEVLPFRYELLQLLFGQHFLLGSLVHDAAHAVSMLPEHRVENRPDDPVAP